MNEKISVVGLGKLGLGLALCFADSGLHTIGVDVNENTVEAINNGLSPIIEPQYQELITKHKDSFKATTSHKEAFENTDITFILVATPSIGDGRFSNRYVNSALKSLAKAFAESKKETHLFVISSTVVPGSTDKEFIPLIEEYSGKKYREDFDVCFDPDFVAIGSVIKDFKNPDLVIIGESSPEAGLRVENLHHKMCENVPKYSRMSIISGEVAKVCLNAYVTMKISFTNSIANLCEKIEGTDLDAITEAVGADKRISPYYFRGGLAFGGTCFPRDTKALMTISDQYGIKPTLISAVEDVNNEQNRHLAEIVKSNIKNDKKVSILGLAFKDKTPVIEESPAIKLIESLINEDYDVTVYDPLAMEAVKVLFNDQIRYANSIIDCLESSKVCVVTLMSDDYKKAVEQFETNENLIVIDCWRQINEENLAKNIKLVAIGRYSNT